MIPPHFRMGCVIAASPGGCLAGGVIGNYVVEMRDGAAVGFTASGVGVGVLPDGHNSVLFVKP